MSVENLKFLHSANRGGERQIHVLVENGSGVTRTTINFSIEGKEHYEYVILEPGEKRSVSISHAEAGRRFVAVTASGCSLETSKKLDLDASESF
jgi:hypothetical protein